MPVTGVVGHSGGVTVGRELSLALAERGHQVVMRVSGPVPDNHGLDVPNFEIQGLDPVPGVDERGQLLRTDGLPSNADVIIGHGRFTGGAASYLRDQVYPDAKVVHVVHALADDLDRLRGDPFQATTHSNTERLLIGKADLAMGVGPLLNEEAMRLARMVDLPPSVAELPPGVLIGEPAPISTPPKQLNMLMFGRIDDPLKGGDIAAGVTRRLNSEGIDTRLTMLGAKPELLKKHEREISERAGSLVRVKPFTSDRERIIAEIKGADLVVMPSTHEGFGLVATEAAGYAAPTFFSSETGAGRLFNDPTRIPDHFGQLCVVQTPSGGGHAELVEAWTNHLKPLISPSESLIETRSRFRELREYLSKNYTWGHSAEALETNVLALASKGSSLTSEVFGPQNEPGRRQPQPSRQNRSKFGKQPQQRQPKGPTTSDSDVGY